VTLHTDIPTRSAVERLVTTRDPFCISIYIPTNPVTQDAQANRIELKNLVADAVEQLQTTQADRGAVTDVRESLDDLVGDDDFWSE
jgi:type III secretory pathway lipoprotein EscJ